MTLYNNCVAKPRNPEAKTTSRQLYWSDVDIISKYRKITTRWGKVVMYEADKDVFHRIVEDYAKNHEPESKTPVSTFTRPVKSTSLQVS